MYKRQVFDAVHVENGTASIREDKCMGCGNCVVTCPAGALRMQVVHDVDWIPDYWADDNNWNIPGENTADYIEKLRAGQD